MVISSTMCTPCAFNFIVRAYPSEHIWFTWEYIKTRYSNEQYTKIVHFMQARDDFWKKNMRKVPILFGHPKTLNRTLVATKVAAKVTLRWIRQQWKRNTEDKASTCFFKMLQLDMKFGQGKFFKYDNLTDCIMGHILCWEQYKSWLFNCHGGLM